MRNVVIFGQNDKNGVIKRGCLELIGLAKRIDIGVEVKMVLFGKEDMDAVSKSAAFGADEIIVITDDYAKVRVSEDYAKAFCKVLKDIKPDVVLFLENPTAREVAGISSVYFDAPIIGQCLDVKYDEINGIHWRKAGFGGKLRSEIIVNNNMTFATSRSGVFSVLEPNVSRRAKVTVLDDIMPKPSNRLVLMNILKNEEIVDLESADVVVAGGRGAQGEKGFALIKELADALGGVVGASRIAVDKGWIGHEHLVGQSGKIITPKLYIACGIAGYVQHLTGMRDSGYIVAINTDPRALIYDVANVSVVGDMFEILPPLIKDIKKIKG